MRKPQTYRQWVKQSGREEELGNKAIVADSFRKKISESALYDLLLKQLTPILVRGLQELGLRPPDKVETWNEEDVSLRAREYGVVLDAIQGEHPLEYLSMAYHCWQEGYKIIKEWESKSIRQYLEWWTLKHPRSTRKCKLITEFLDKVDPLHEDDIY